MQSLLSEYPDVYTYAEPKLFSHYLNPWFKAWARDRVDPAPHGLPAIWSEDEFHAFICEFLSRVYDRVAESMPAGAIVVDKTPQGDEIETLIPDAKYLHVIRDGRDVAASLMAASTCWGKSWAPGSVEGAAKWWRAGVKAARAAQRYQNEGRHLKIRYEDLLSDAASQLKKVSEFLEFDPALYDVERIVERHKIERMRNEEKLMGRFNLPAGFVGKGGKGGWRERFTSLDCHKFQRIAGDLLREFGYVQED